MGGDTVIGKQGVEDGAEDVSLCIANVCDDAGWSPFSNPDGLGPASQKV